MRSVVVYGESLVNITHSSGNYDEPYQFGGHHLDQESGMLYRGARYNEPKLGIEISTDAKWYMFPHLSSYNSMGNNPIMLIDPDGNENVIYLMNLQKGKTQKIKASALIKEVNAQFKALGLKTRMVLAPKGFNSKYTDATDSYVALGSVADAKSFILENNPEYAEFNDWRGGVVNPEKSSNTQGQKTKAIGIDVNAAAGSASDYKETTPTQYVGFLVLHGAGHNANLNHSDDERGARRDGQSVTNAALMSSGKWLETVFNDNKQFKVNDIMDLVNFKTTSGNYSYTNDLYVKIMKKYFGDKTATDNYLKNKNNANN
jgi:RHS repeat-associated protein